MEKSINVRVMGREYSLRVNQDDEKTTREVAAYVDAKMTAFRKAFPRQSETTTAVIAALAIAEELYILRDRQGQDFEDADYEIDQLTALLDQAIQGE